jgi:hypothetical protein
MTRAPIERRTYHKDFLDPDGKKREKTGPDTQKRPDVNIEAEKTP